MLKISNLFSLFKARKTAGGIADFQQLQKYGIGCEEGDFCKACKKMEFLSEFFPEILRISENLFRDANEWRSIFSVASIFYL